MQASPFQHVPLPIAVLNLALKHGVLVTGRGDTGVTEGNGVAQRFH